MHTSTRDSTYVIGSERTRYSRLAQFALSPAHGNGGFDCFTYVVPSGPDHGTVGFDDGLAIFARLCMLVARRVGQSGIIREIAFW